ncbi:MAG: TadE family protein [bacterium]
MKRENGQSMVEMLVMIPILFMLLVGIFEAGIIYHNHLILSQTAREGAKFASLGATNHEVKEKIYEAADALINSFFVRGELHGPIAIEAPFGKAIGNPIIVTINYRIFFGFPLGTGAVSIIKVDAPASCTMRISQL